MKRQLEAGLAKIVRQPYRSGDAAFSEAVWQAAVRALSEPAPRGISDSMDEADDDFLDPFEYLISNNPGAGQVEHSCTPSGANCEVNS